MVMFCGGQGNNKICMFTSIKNFFTGSKPEDLSKLPKDDIEQLNKDRCKKILQSLPFNTDEESKSNGLVGLSNLGNTCYMNAALQCLTKSKELTELMLNQSWHSELNCVGVFGSKGVVFAEYYKLVYNMFHSEDGSRISPKELKNKFGATFKQFDNYYQHDSQEFLAYLLSCLHEDSNRVVKKPYNEVKDYDAIRQTETEYFKYCKGLILNRDSSKITDLFAGMTRMSIVCPIPECKYQALKYEQFTMLTVPLFKTKDQIEVSEFHFMDYEGIYHLKKRKVQHAKSMTIGQALDKINSLEKTFQKYPYQMYQFDQKHRKVTRVTETKENLYTFQQRTDDILLMIQDTCPDLPPDEKEENDILLRFYVKDSEIKAFSKPLYIGRKNTVSCLYKFVFKKSSRLAENYLGSWPQPQTEPEIDQPKNYQETPEEAGSEKNHTAQTSSTKVTNTEVSKQNAPKLKFVLTLVKPDETRIPLDFTDTKTLADLGVEDSFVRIEIEYLTEKLNSVKGLTRYLVDDETGYPIPLTESRKGKLNIYECLDGFSEEETLDQYNAWKCPKCKNSVTADLSTNLAEVPQLLVIHLKRFKKAAYSRKISEVVDFPVKGLQLDRFMVQSAAQAQEPVVYDLYAITNHYGDTGGGHYTAYAKDLNEDKWYEFDDSSVRKVRSDTLNQF